MPTLRLLSVNARTLPLDRSELAALIAKTRPDVACVHGSPSLLRWRSISAGLARRAGMVVVGGGRTGGGNLVMSTLGVDVLATRDLSFDGFSGVRPPGATLAVLRLRGSEFVFAGAWLLGSPTARLVQARQLQEAIAALVPGVPPTLISAEGSDRPDTAAWQALTENRVAVAGGVFVDGRIGIGDAQELDGAWSTCAPVRVDLSLPPS